jgi:hypothetical protein
VGTNVPPKLVHSGPNEGCALKGAHKDAFVFHLLGRHNITREALLSTLAYHQSDGAIGYLLHGWKHLPFSSLKPKKGNVYAISRLAALNEAGGKVRVIGILDYFTQWALRPLHDFLFRILKIIPTDGTHSQDKCLDDFLKRVEGRTGTFYSYDISAATDTIPWQLYREILSSIFFEEYSKTVLRLMRDRLFLIPGKGKRKFTQYTKGQPMGAYASFALLGLAHHVLLQMAAFQCGRFPFWDYGIVGDDIVIFDEDGLPSVGKCYLQLCKVFTIPISLNKSFVSADFFGFLSRYFYRGREITPVSLKQELSVRSLTQRVESGIQLLRRGVGLKNTKSNQYGLHDLIRLCSQPCDKESMIQYRTLGLLSPYLTKVLSLILSPYSRFNREIGLRGPVVAQWIASIRGSIRAITATHTNVKESWRIGHLTQSSYILLLRVIVSLLKSAVLAHLHK